MSGVAPDEGAGVAMAHQWGGGGGQFHRGVLVNTMKYVVLNGDELPG